MQASLFLWHYDTHTITDSPNWKQTGRNYTFKKLKRSSTRAIVNSRLRSFLLVVGSCKVYIYIYIADNETLVSWRFDVDNLFSTCTNRYAMNCTIWNQDQPILTHLGPTFSLFLPILASKTTFLKSFKFIVKNRVLGT